MLSDLDLNPERTRRNIVLYLPERSPKSAEGSAKILIVEQDPGLCAMLAAMLRNSGYRVDTAENVCATMDKLENVKYEVLVLDAEHPEFSKADVLDQIKNYPTMEVVLLTNHPTMDQAIEFVRNGAFDYIGKPFATERFIKSLYAAVARQRKEYRRRLNHAVFGDCQYDFEDILQDYTLLKVLGNGSSGAVFLVRLPNNELRAIKILRRASTENHFQNLSARFLREAKILSSLSHPHIIKIFEYGIHPVAKLPYMIMEYVDGGTVYDFLKTFPDLNEKLRIIEEVADALATVHAKGVLHRDVKPPNILMDENGSTRLTDFGVAHIEDSSLTIENELVGSPAYFAPEACVKGGLTDERSDIFSLGVLAYELLVGHRPFYGETVSQIMKAITSEKPIPPRRLNPEIPPEVETILGKMLAKNKTTRYQKAADIVNSIGAYRDRIQNTKVGEEPDFIGRLLSFIYSPLSSVWAEESYKEPREQ